MPSRIRDAVGDLGWESGTPAEQPADAQLRKWPEMRTHVARPSALLIQLAKNAEANGQPLRLA